MTTSEYDQLLRAYGWKRIDDNPQEAEAELYLINLARDHGEPFKQLFDEYYKEAWSVPFFKFPVATTANEQHKNTDTMNIQINITADDKILDAINNLASAVSGGWKGNAGDRLEAKLTNVAPTTEETETPATPANPEPKKREKKTAPAPKAPEPDPLENVPTGAELAERISVLKGTPYTKQLKAYMDNDLSLVGTRLADVTDVEDLKKIETKINELLEAAKADDV